MPYLKNCLDGDGEVYSGSLIGFVGKSSLEFIMDCIKGFEEGRIGFEPFANVGCIILTPFISIYYLVYGPFSYKVKFNHEGSLEGNLS